MSDNGNNVHFSGVRFICSPYLAIKSALASLGPIMARCGPQMNLTPLKMNIIVILEANRVIRQLRSYCLRLRYIKLGKDNDLYSQMEHMVI